MPSPFPGMDPYLEGNLWPDVHNALAYKIRQLLTPKLRPRYAARLEIQVLEDDDPEAELGIMYPDVEVVLKHGQRAESSLPKLLPAGPSFSTGVSPPLVIPLLPTMQFRYASIEIRDSAQNMLITTIEILSPVNKRGRHLQDYREKRQKLFQAGVHLLELDFVRRGTRPYSHPRIPKTPYLVTLTRAKATAAEVWPIGLRDTLPTVLVPLRTPDPDVSLPLQDVIEAIYEDAGYDVTIDYDQPPPPPPLSKDDLAWLRSVIAQQQV